MYSDSMIVLKISLFDGETRTSKKKSDFPCYFFEHGYLSNYAIYYYINVHDSSSYPFRVKCVSDFLFWP